MMASDAMPAQEEFMTAPRDVIAGYAPRSMVYAPGGTRRSATFAGIQPWTPVYLRMLHDQFAKCLQTIFHYGVAHVFTPMVMTTHANEVDDVVQQLILPLGKFASDPHLLALCRKHNWRLRIAPSSYGELLQPYMEEIEEKTPRNAKHTWWMTCTPSYESWWSSLLGIAKSEAVTTRSEAIRALYGEDVPPINLCISFGKPMISPDLFPLLLMDNVHCYWSQQVGHSLTDEQFRKVLYDYAFLRQTWQKDKTARAKEAQAHRDIWEQEFILGLGKRLGPFWYPDVPGQLTAESEQGA